VTWRKAWQLVTNTLKSSKQCVYLGSLITTTNDVSVEIQRRIQTAKKCFFGLRKHLQSSNLSRHSKFNIHKTLICLYGRKTWMLTKMDENQFPYLRGRFSERYAAQKSKMVSTGEGTTTNSMKSLTVRMPLMS
jgi:hypothetical protein